MRKGEKKRLKVEPHPRLGCNTKDFIGRSPNQKAQQKEPRQGRQDERRQRNSSCPAGFCFALHDRAKKRPGPRLLLASHISPGTRTRDRARRWYTRCHKFAMDDVEGGTRLSGDALSGGVDASKNRIPNGDCINRHEFWVGRGVLQSVGHGITGGGSYFPDALEYLFDG